MLEKLKNICADYTEVSMDTVNESTDLRSDLGLNSLELANVLVALEDEFGVEIPDRDAMGFITIGDVAAYLTDKLA